MGAAPGGLSNADSTRRLRSPCTRRLSSWRRWRMPAVCTCGGVAESERYSKHVERAAAQRRQPSGSRTSQSPARLGTHTSHAWQCATRAVERGPGWL